MHRPLLQGKNLHPIVIMRRYLVSPYRLALAAFVVLIGTATLALLGGYQYLRPSLPDVTAIKDIRLQVPLRVYSRDGKLIAQFGEQRRIPLAFDAIPSQLVNAVLAAEDDRFFEHGGIDYPGLTRAIVRHLLSGERGEGGGTITMQLARGIFLSPDKTYRRKLQEIFLALRIEQELTKQEILALYMNKGFLGQRAYGIGAAAEVYFGKSVDQLTLPEIALIAGTFRLPSRDNPIANADLARQRRAYVLRRMREKEFIAQDEHDAAVAAPVESKLHGPAVEIEAPYAAEMARAALLERFGAEAYTAGYEAITTIDSRLQRAAITALRAALLEYDQRHGYRGPIGRVTLAKESTEKEWTEALEEHAPRAGLEPAVIVNVGEKEAVAYSRVNGRVALKWPGISWAREPRPDGSLGPALERAGDVLSVGDVIYIAQERNGAWRMVQMPEAQGAFVALDPQDGAVTALIGGFDYYASNYNRAVQARRQPGSAFKPFLYAAALDQGFTTASIVNDAPLVIEDPTLEASWRPQNNTREFRGPMRLREALVRSRNLVSIRVMHALGPAYATRFIQRFGFAENALPRNLSLALGTAQVSPLEMARGYAVFANGGFLVEPYYLQRVIGPDGTSVFEAAPKFACSECAQPAPETSMQSEGVDAPIRVQSTDEARWGGLTYLDEQRLAPSAISPQNSYLMTDMMRDVINRGTAIRARQLQRTDLAGKTGTTNDRRDAWFCGFNSGLVGAAWVGFDQERSLGPGEEGSRTALPMWIYFMAEALKGVPERKVPPPPGLVSMRISADTGLAARPGEPNAIFETFMAGHLPPEAPSDGSIPIDFESEGEQAEGDDSLF
jgi:penicillin-binding protein 1A